MKIIINSIEMVKRNWYLILVNIGFGILLIGGILLLLIGFGELPITYKLGMELKHIKVFSLIVGFEIIIMLLGFLGFILFENLKNVNFKVGKLW